MEGGFRGAILLAGGTLAFGGVAGSALWILPAPHEPFHYLLAGALATAVVLAAMLVLTSLRGAGRGGRTVRCCRLSGPGSAPELTGDK